jgi:hypothetical protein
MTGTSLWTSLRDFFLKPYSPWPAAAFRVLFGLCVCATLLMLHGDWLNWFGVQGWISMATIDQAESGFRLNLFAIFPQDNWIAGLYWLFLTASVTLVIGLCTRISSMIVFLGLNSINQRMPLILHGGDAFLRSAGFFLIFASSGAVFSVDNWLRSIRRPSERALPRLIAPWPLRLVQCQLAILYLTSFWWKAKGSTWRDGSALFYVLHLRELHRFPIPKLFYKVWPLRFGTWSAMAFELLFPCLVWFRKCRNPILMWGLLFHLTLEYALNIPMFQWDVLSAYVLFLDFGRV